jgi:hypothetical protein
MNVSKVYATKLLALTSLTVTGVHTQSLPCRANRIGVDDRYKMDKLANPGS